MILQVFEHQTIQVGNEINGVLFSKEHFNALSRFSEQHQHKYYSLVYNGVRFSHYVGALQVGDLCIEILPKADRDRNPDKEKWRDILLDMLRYCRLLKLETRSNAWLKLRPNAILNLYFEIFLNEVELLLRQGLIKSYHKKERNGSTLKGQLVFAKQVSKNAIHPQRLYTRHDRFDFDHLANQVLKNALDILDRMVLVPKLRVKLQRLQTCFRSVQNREIREEDLRRITSSRKLSTYTTALEIARLLILNYHPDIRGGKNHVLAILFDMNVLFEEYIYQCLSRLQSQDIQVKRQVQKTFWNRSKLRPDILLRICGENFIIDTKWKALKKAKPSMEDLRQVFVYNQYFEADRSILLYPKVYDVSDLPPTPYHLTPKQTTEVYCQLTFAELLKDGKLNKNLGEEILSKIAVANFIE